MEEAETWPAGSFLLVRPLDNVPAQRCLSYLSVARLLCLLPRAYCEIHSPLGLSSASSRLARFPRQLGLLAPHANHALAIVRRALALGCYIRLRTKIRSCFLRMEIKQVKNRAALLITASFAPPGSVTPSLSQCQRLSPSNPSTVHTLSECLLTLHHKFAIRCARVI